MTTNDLLSYCNTQYDKDDILDDLIYYFPKEISSLIGDYYFMLEKMIDVTLGCRTVFFATVRFITILWDGRILSNGIDPGIIRIWHPKNYTYTVLQGHSDAVTCLAVISAEQIVSGSLDTSLIIWDILSYGGIIRLRLLGHTEQVNCVASNRQWIGGSNSKNMGFNHWWMYQYIG